MGRFPEYLPTKIKMTFIIKPDNIVASIFILNSESDSHGQKLDSLSKSAYVFRTTTNGAPELVCQCF